MGHIALQIVTGARNLVVILILGFVWPAFETSLALAQGTTAITPTTGVGSLETAVTANGNTIQITGGTRPGNGTNLFHSFDQFNVGRPDTAQFLNTTPSLPTSNILGRVTGGNPSSIFGTIDTMSYPGANLFLMNPAGIVFGLNATLHVGGSVAFTTANYLRLAEADDSQAGIFHAETTATSLLTSASVAAFGFLGSNPAAIAVQGSRLEMQSGQSISLVGGNQGFTYTNPGTGSRASAPDGVTVTGGTLLAESGQVHIASVASPGEITAGTLEYAPNVNGQSFGALGTIQISQQTSIDTSGEGGGTILIRGGRLVVDASMISANTGDISLDATSIRITDAAQIATVTETAANAGHIILKASGNIDMDSFALVGSLSTNSSGHAGNITFNSSHGNVNLTSNATVLSQTDNSSGNSGNIKIDAPHGDILLDHSSSVFNTASGTGTLGDIQIKAHDLHLSDGSKIGGDNTSTQVPGNIAITLDGHLSLAGGSFINTQALGSAASADLIIRAPDVLITGKDSFDIHSGLYTGTISSGNGGRLSLFTDNLQLTDGGMLSSKSFVGAEGEIPSGRSGVISIQGLRSPGTSVAIDGPGSGIFTNAEGTRAGGNTVLSARTLTIQNGGTITAGSTGPGDAGDITINGDSLTIASGGRVEASTSGTGDGGSIAITTTGDVTVTGLSADGQVRSGIFAKTLSAGGGSGGGGGGSGGGSGGGAPKPGSAGNITIDANNLLLDGGAQIDSSTTSGGAGGTVSITTTENITIAGSSTRLTSDATRGNGKGGDITLVAKNITVRDRANVTAVTGGKGDAGNVTLMARDQLLLQSAGTITTSTSGSGKGGTIVIQAGQVLLNGQGTAITADTLRPFADMTITIDILHPNDGDLVVQLDSPTGTRVALLSRVGQAGDNFTDTSFNDQATAPITSGSAPFTGTFTPREPLGQLNNELVAGNWALTVRDQATDNVGSLESWTLQIGAQTFQSTGGSSVIPDNGNVLRSTITVANPIVPTVQAVGEPAGIGGNITLTASQSVTMSDGASVSASSSGPGNAGNIKINAGQQFEMRDSSITTQATKASGGNIDIQAVDLIRMVNSETSSSVQGDASTAGGNITIDPNVVVLQNSAVTARASQGTGGNITITTPLFLADSSSLVSASSQFGLNGTVTIQSPTSNLSGSLGPLASKPSQAQALLTQRCAALVNGQASSFVVAGREQLPADPGSWLTSPLAFAALSESLEADYAIASAPAIMAIAADDTSTVSLRRLTPAGFLMANFADSEATGCRS